MSDQAFKVLICGSSMWTNKDKIKDVLFKAIYQVANVVKSQEEFDSMFQFFTSNCKGVDTIAKDILSEFNVKCEVIPYDEEKYGKENYDKLNDDMLNDIQPDLILAFLNKNNVNKYSWDLIQKAVKTLDEVEIYIVTDDSN